MTSLQSDPEIRLIEADSAPSRFARGWHCLGLHRDFADGKPHAVEAFGTKLVVFRETSGKINILDAYCRHMGGDLSEGEIKGDEIACPFHDWRWGGDGRCKKIPYARRVPPLARTRTWTSLEQDGMLFVWHDPEGKAPTAQETIPRIEGAESNEWTDWHWYTTIVDNNCREIIDNVVDMAHFYYVHGSLPSYFKNVFEGHIATQYFKSAAREDFAAPEGQPKLLGSTSVASYYGPAFMIDELTYHYETGDQRTVLLNCHYPVSADKFVLMYGIIGKKIPGVPEDVAVQAAVALGDYIRIGFEQDVEIWRHKVRIDNPLLCEEDGPVYQLRRWYNQFYLDRADVTPEMVDRFEHELDLSKAQAVWRKEVADNIADQARSTGTPT